MKDKNKPTTVVYTRLTDKQRQSLKRLSISTGIKMAKLISLGVDYIILNQDRIKYTVESLTVEKPEEAEK